MPGVQDWSPDPDRDYPARSSVVGEIGPSAPRFVMSDEPYRPRSARELLLRLGRCPSALPFPGKNTPDPPNEFVQNTFRKLSARGIRGASGVPLAPSAYCWGTTA